MTLDPEIRKAMDEVRARVRANSGSNVVHFRAPTDDGRPDLVVDKGDLTVTARVLRDLFARRRCFLDNGNTPIYICEQADGGMPIAKEANKHRVVLEAHRICRPVMETTIKGSPVLVETTLPERVAELYLAMAGEWYLPSFMGISCAPILADDGGMRIAKGYDEQTGLWCHQIPTVDVPEYPSIDEAEAAILLLRDSFKTFCFADAKMIRAPQLGIDLVDLDNPPGLDESAFLAGLMTAVCRPSLHLAPGLLARAPVYLWRRDWQGPRLQGRMRHRQRRSADCLHAGPQRRGIRQASQHRADPGAPSGLSRQRQPHRPAVRYASLRTLRTTGFDSHLRPDER